MTNILLVDDDKKLTRPLSASLQDAGYIVSVAHDGKSGLALALDSDPDIVILDVMMPEMDGWAVCQNLRQQSPVPILMLTALGDEIDRILGLELGADDYLTKPFSTRELLVRIKALLRRVALDQSEINKTVQIGAVQIDHVARKVFKADELLTMRHKEFELLSLLMSRAGKVVNRAEIFDAVWGTDWLGDTRTLDVHIRWLREKIEDNPGSPTYIETVRGVGYRFQQAR